MKMPYYLETNTRLLQNDCYERPIIFEFILGSAMNIILYDKLYTQYMG